MKWSCAQSNFPLLTLYFALTSADVLWRPFRCCTVNCRKYYETSASKSHCLYWLQQWVAHSVWSSTGKLKTKGACNPLTEQQGWACFIRLVSHRTLTRDYDRESTVFKTSNSSSTYSPGLGRSVNALLLGQSVSKPDLVAVSCVFIKRG